MIRPADRADLIPVTDLVLEFLRSTPYGDHFVNINDKDIEHIKRMIYLVLKAETGQAWVAEIDNEPVGLLMSVLDIDPWIPRKKYMQEVVFYVKPEYRNGLMPGKLFKAYADLAEQLVSEQKIEGYFVSQLANVPQYDLESRGFKLVEHRYMKD